MPCLPGIYTNHKQVYTTTTGGLPKGVKKTLLWYESQALGICDS